MKKFFLILFSIIVLSGSYSFAETQTQSVQSFLKKHCSSSSDKASNRCKSRARRSVDEQRECEKMTDKDKMEDCLKAVEKKYNKKIKRKDADSKDK